MFATLRHLIQVALGRDSDPAPDPYLDDEEDLLEEEEEEEEDGEEDDDEDTDEDEDDEADDSDLDDDGGDDEADEGPDDAHDDDDEGEDERPGEGRAQSDPLAGLSPEAQAQILQSVGLGKYRSIQDALRGAAEAQRYISQGNEAAKQWQQVQPYMPAFQQWMAHQQQSKEQRWWNPPHPYDDRMKRLESIVRTGSEEAWNSLSPDDQRAVTEYMGWRNEKMAEFANNPEVMWENVYAPRVSAFIDRKFEELKRDHASTEWVNQVRDLVEHPEAYKMLDQLLAEGIPGPRAEELVRYRFAFSNLSEKEKKIATRAAQVNQAKQTAKSQNGLRKNAPAKTGLRVSDSDLEKMSPSALRRHVLKMEKAGLLDD